MPPHQAVRYHTLPGPKPRADQLPSADPHILSSVSLSTEKASSVKGNKEVDYTCRRSDIESFDPRMAQRGHNTRQAMWHTHPKRRRTSYDARVREDVLARLAGKELDSTESPGVTQRRVELNNMAELQQGTKQLFSPSRVHYHYTKRNLSSRSYHRGFDCDVEGHNREPRQSLRNELRHKRRSALMNMRRALAATLLSYEARTANSIGSADLLASLPDAERPTSSTQIGKFITGLGFYDTTTNEISDTDISGQSKTLVHDKEPGNQPLQSTLASDIKSTRGISQSRLRFSPTPRMRASNQDPAFFESSIWGQSVIMETNPGMSDQGDASGDGSASPAHDSGNEASPGGNAQKDRPQHSSDQSNTRNSQTQDHNMEKNDNEEPSSESEHEDESENDETDADAEEAEEPHVPLTYQIPPEVLDNALQAPAQTRASYWTQKFYRGPNNEELLLYYCQNMEVSEKVAKYFLNEKVVGFDIEWKVFSPVDSIKDNASLIQIASENRIALFHIARFPGKTAEQLMPPTLKTILESPDTLKVGVAIKGDCSRLEKYFDLRIRGVFELSRLYNLVEHYATDPRKVNKKLMNLATQVKQHLLLPLYKGEQLLDEPHNIASVRESDWTRQLDHEQIHYAAADAYAGFRLFDVLESKRKKLKPTPPIPLVCDFDVKPTPRSSTKVKRVKKAKVDTERAVAEALSGLNAEDPEEEAYETAAEELVDEDETEDMDTSSDSESSAESDDPDADYMPKRQGRFNLESLADGNAASDKPSRHIGRVDLKRLPNDNPNYPKLPLMSSQEDSSDESDAFDPPPPVRQERGVKPSAPKEVAPPLPTLNDLEDEYPDPELEEAFSSMDLDPTPTTLAQPTSTDTSPTDPPTPFTLATTWSQSYLSSTIPPPPSSSSGNPTSPPRIRATIPPLRAYHLWHHQRIPLDAIGAYLRDPPLAQSTVCNYIVQAITMEKLEYREEELRELVKGLPASVRVGRYGWLSRKVGVGR